MVQERKEPTLSGIKPERDEIMTHQSRMNNRPSGGASRTPPARSKTGGSLLAGVALLFGLAGTAVAGYSTWQLQQAQADLVASEDRIASLEARIDLTSSESSETVDDINEKLEWADSEIRKLWGVAYDTNRKAIEANKDSAANALRVANEAKQTSAGQQSALTSMKNTASEQQLLMTKLSDDMNQLQQRLQTVRTSVSELEGTVQKLNTDLTARVAGNEEAIKAIDAFRRSANADILRLKQQLGQAPQ